MKISCNTFEAFVVTLSRNSPGFGELNCRHCQISRSWARYTTRATAARCFAASSALTCGRSLRSPSFSTVTLSGVEILRQFSMPNSRNNARTCLRSRRTLQVRSRPIPLFYRDGRLSSPINIVPTHTHSAIVSSATSDLHVVLCTANRPHCLMLKHPWVTDSLNLMSSCVFRRWSGRIIGTSRVPHMARSSVPTSRPDAAKGYLRWQLTVHDLLVAWSASFEGRGATGSAWSGCRVRKRCSRA